MMFNLKARSAIAYAKSFIGVPYKWGGETPMAGYDCCLTQDSLVQTPDGFKKITEFKSGDQVLSYDNGQVVVSDVIDVHQNGLKQVYKIKTTSSSLRCTDNHKFLTVKQPEESKKGWTIRKHRKLDWVELKDLKKGDIVVMPRNLKQKKEVEYTKEQIVFFGAVLGDGTVTSKGINLCFVSDKKKEYVELMREYARKGFGFDGKASFHETHGIMFINVGIRKQIIDMGLNSTSSKRSLPSWVYKLDANQLEDFLFGYLLADGSRFERASEKGYAVSSASAQLIKELHLLLHSRGYRVQNVKKTERKKPIFIKGVKVKNPLPLWTLSINDNPIRPFPERNIGPDPYNDFNISEQYTFHRITSIVKEGIEETFDLTILNSHSYFANGFVVHNSGFVQEILSSVGLDPVGDQTAQALADYYVSFGDVVDKPKAGCLVFFGQARIKITHVGFMINNFQMIEAGGGGRQVVDKQSAIDHRAFIRVRPYTYRSDLIYLIDPF